MPDLDIVERNIPSYWRKPYRLMKGEQPLEVVVAELIKAATAQLRVDRGIPGLAEFDTAIRRAPDPVTLARFVRELERRFVNYRAGQNLSRAARRQAVLIANGGALPSQVGLAKDYFCQMWSDYIFGRIEPTLVGPGRPFHNLAEVRAYEQRCREMASPALDSLAKRLARQPTGERLRAPTVWRKRRSTAELIDSPLVMVPSK